MTKPPADQKPRFFYGYWIVLATFCCMFIMGGVGIYAFSLFVKPLQEELGWGRGEIMAAFTIYFLVFGATSPFIGRMIDRFGARKVIAAGAIIAGLGFALVSQINSLWQFYASYAIVGAGLATMGHVPSSAVVSKWFNRSRGTVLGFMSTGIGAGGVALAPVIGGYLIPNFGWRAAYLAMGALVYVLIIPLALLVIKTEPAEMGLLPDGGQAPEPQSIPASLPVDNNGIPLKIILGTSAFWLIAIAYLTGSFSQIGMFQNQMPHLVDIGFPVATAAAAISSNGLGSIIGKIVFGWLCDRMPAKYGWTIGIALQTISLLILMRIEPTSPVAMIWLYAMLLGLSVGSWLPTMSMSVSTNFGLSAYGTTYGIVALAQSTGIALGPLMAGSMYDLTGTYHRAFDIFLALNVVAILAILAVRRPKSLQTP